MTADPHEDAVDFDAIHGDSELEKLGPLDRIGGKVVGQFDPSSRGRDIAKFTFQTVQTVGGRRCKKFDTAGLGSTRGAALVDGTHDRLLTLRASRLRAMEREKIAKV
jgi:hypothetical protein